MGKIGLRRLRSRTLQMRWLCSLMAFGLACWIVWHGTVAAEVSPSAPSPASITPAISQVEPVAGAKPALKVQPEANPEDLKSPPVSSTPIKVLIGLHLSNLADLNQVSESFDIAGYLLYSWHDPRLAFTPKPNSAKTKTYTLDEIWHPALETVNFKAIAFSETYVDVTPDGTVVAQERFSKTLSSELELQNFPFDRQHLQIVIESLKYGDQTVELAADKSKLSIGMDSFVSLSEWHIGKLTAIQGKGYFPPEKQYYSRVTLQVNVKRNSGFYVFKVMLPLLLITIASWSVFWLRAEEFSTQITIAFTNLLTVVALMLVINDSLPRVGYLTFMDGFTLICFTTILITILELVLAHRLTSPEKQGRVQTVHRLARWIFPTIFVISNLVLLASMNFLRGY